MKTHLEHGVLHLRDSAFHLRDIFFFIFAIFFISLCPKRNIRHICIKYIISKSSTFVIRRWLRHNVFYKAILNFFRREKWKSEKLWQLFADFTRFIFVLWTHPTSSVQDEKYSNLFCKQEIHSSKHCALLVQSQYELIMELEGTVFDDTNSRKCNTSLEHEFLSERPFNYACTKSVVEENVCRWKKMDAVIREA